MQRRLMVLACISAGLLIVSSACQKRVPYPSARDVVHPNASDVTPSAALVGDTSPSSIPTGPHPLLVVLTPHHSLLITASGETPPRLDVKKVEGLVRVLPDGSVRVQRARLRPLAKREAPIREVVVANLSFFADGLTERPIVPGLFGQRPDFAAVAEADPDIADTFYHREALTLVGVLGTQASWVASTEGFLGGAHPYSSRTLLITDTETGATREVMSRFKGRDIVAEALGAGADEECVRRLLGVLPAQGVLGVETWIAGFGHAFEFCAGAFRMRPIAPPSDRIDPAPMIPATLVDGTLAILSRNVRFTGVADARVSDSADAAVLLMGLGQGDRLVPAWTAAQPQGGDAVSRELRVWVAGLVMPAVIGRVPVLLAVQFLSDHPEPERVLRSWAGLSATPSR